MRPTYLLNGTLTILKKHEDSVKDAAGLSLSALAWLLSDDVRARRFLDVTGLCVDTLRDTVGLPATQRAVLDFLCAHEPDLVAAAESLDIAPQELAAARERLGA